MRKLKEFKVRVFTKEYSINVQTKLIELGCTWRSGSKNIYEDLDNHILMVKDGKLSHYSDIKIDAEDRYFNLHDLYTDVIYEECKPITRKELLEAAAPLMKLLNDPRCHPHMKVEVCCMSVELLGGLVAGENTEFLKD